MRDSVEEPKPVMHGLESIQRVATLSVYAVGAFVGLGWLASNYAFSSYLQMPISQTREAWFALGLLICLSLSPAALLAYFRLRQGSTTVPFVLATAACFVGFAIVCWAFLYAISRPEIAPFSARILTDPLGQLGTEESRVFVSGATRLTLMILGFDLAIGWVIVAMARSLAKGNSVATGILALPLAGLLILHSFEFGRLAIPLIKPEFGGMLLKEAEVQLRAPDDTLRLVIIAVDGSFVVAMRETKTSKAVESLLFASRSDEIGRRLVFIPIARVVRLQPKASLELW